MGFITASSTFSLPHAQALWSWVMSPSSSRKQKEVAEALYIPSIKVVAHSFRHLPEESQFEYLHEMVLELIKYYSQHTTRMSLAKSFPTIPSTLADAQKLYSFVYRRVDDYAKNANVKIMRRAKIHTRLNDATSYTVTLSDGEKKKSCKPFSFNPYLNMPVGDVDIAIIRGLIDILDGDGDGYSIDDYRKLLEIG